MDNTPHITGGELDNDPDTDAVPNNLLKTPPVYVGDQKALVAAITAELQSGGVNSGSIAKYMPLIESMVNGLLTVFAPGLVPVATVVENVVNDIAGIPPTK